MGKQAKVWNGSAWVSISPSASDGKSAYQLALENGFSGTMSDWLVSLTGPIGPAGPAGPTGGAGPTGPAGPGVIVGGTTGQLLAKASNADYHVQWVDAAPYAPGTGSSDGIVADGQIIGGVKTQWTDPGTGYVYNIHTFSYNAAYLWGVTTDTLECLSPVTGLLLVVAGGGAGGTSGTFSYGGGGGGGGGVFFGAYAFGTGIHNLYVGRGGKTASASGAQSHFDDLIVPGGGGGGSNGGSGANGGSGGGGSGNTSGGSPGGTKVNGTGYAAEFHYGANGSGGGVGFSGNGGSSGLSTGIFDSGVATAYANGGGGKAGAVNGTDGRGHGGGGAANNGSDGAFGTGGNGIIKVRYRIA